jgi:hypothetical protein
LFSTKSHKITLILSVVILATIIHFGTVEGYTIYEYPRMFTSPCITGQGEKFNPENNTFSCQTMTGGNSTNSSPAPKIVINSNNRTSFNSVANTTSTNMINSHSVSFPNSNSGTILLSNQTLSSLTGTLASNIGVTTLSNSGHASTFPTTTGTLCQINQTGTCGASFSTPAPKITINGNNRTSFISVANLTSVNLINGHSISFPSLNSGTLLLGNGSGSSLTNIPISISVIGSGSASSSTGAITITTKTYQNNTGTNLGTVGSGVYTSNSGSVLQFLKLVAGPNISITANGTNIRINGTAGGTVTSVSGTTGNITSTGGTTPVINLGSTVLVTGGSTQTVTKGLTITGIVDLKNTGIAKIGSSNLLN